MSRSETQELLRSLGFHLDETTFLEVFDDVDSDDDDALILEEFITCVGMIKKSVLEVRELEASFTRFRAADPKRKLSLVPGVDAPAGLAAGGEEEHKIFASDLVAALGVSEEIAEEMIYIADLQENQSITFTEFRQVVVNWD